MHSPNTLIAYISSRPADSRERRAPRPRTTSVKLIPAMVRMHAR
jgi:hypothetical protein